MKFSDVENCEIRSEVCNAVGTMQIDVLHSGDQYCIGAYEPERTNGLYLYFNAFSTAKYIGYTHKYFASVEEMLEELRTLYIEHHRRQFIAGSLSYEENMEEYLTKKSEAAAEKLQALKEERAEAREAGIICIDDALNDDGGLDDDEHVVFIVWYRENSEFCIDEVFTNERAAIRQAMTLKSDYDDVEQVGYMCKEVYSG